jgi:hypothetical protein
MSRKLIGAFLIVPWITSAVITVPLSPYAYSFSGVLVVFLLYAASAYIVEVFLGIPAFLLYRFFRWRGYIAHGMGGLALGFLVISLVAIIYSPFTRTTPGEFILCMIAGAASGLAFRFIAGEDSRNRQGAIGGEI